MCLGHYTVENFERKPIIRTNQKKLFFHCGLTNPLCMNKGKREMRKWIGIDTAKLKPAKGVSYQLDNWLFNDSSNEVRIPEKPSEEKAALNDKCICLRTLPKYLKEESYNRIWFKPLKNRLTRKESIRWLTLACQHKLLPDYINPKQEAFVFKLGPDVPPILLYIYLTTPRQMEEEPEFIKAVLYLVDEHDMDFYCALVIAARTVLYNSWHMYIECERWSSMPIPKDISLAKFSLKSIVGLRRFLNNPTKYDCRNYREFDNWNATNTIEAISSIKTTITIRQCYSPNILKAIYAPSDANIRECLSKLNNKSMKIRKTDFATLV
jgi:hypothetical protein